MIEIIILVLLARSIGNLARQKGLRPATWQTYLVVGWIAAEITGIVVGVLLVGPKNLVTVVFIGLGFAFSSYFILRRKLEEYPDYMDDEIDHIGT